MSQSSSVTCAVADGDLLVEAEVGLAVDALLAQTTTHAPSAQISLKGTARGLEIVVAEAASADVLGVRLTELLSEAPGFFAGSDARVVAECPLPHGALAQLEMVAERFALTIVEIAPARRTRSGASNRREDTPPARLADGTGPIAEPASASSAKDATPAESPVPVFVAFDEVPFSPEAAPIAVALANTAPYSSLDITVNPDPGASGRALAPPDAGSVVEPAAVAAGSAPSITCPPPAALDVATPAIGDVAASVAASPVVSPASPAPTPGPTAEELTALIEVAATTRAAALIAAMPAGPRLVMGPVRSGVIVDHTGHVIVIGDVNPGAEVRAEGNIIVLGRLRGVAHAAIGRDAGFIVSLSLQPQQLRIGRMVARAGDADRAGTGAEIAYVTGEAIVVDRFLGRLPSGLAASI